MQKNQYVIAYQGATGSNANLVCSKYFPNNKYNNYVSFDEIFNAVEKKEADFGIIPIENSYAGRVSEIHNLLKNTNLYIVGEYFLDIEHSLAGLPSAKITDIKTVFSHPQALMQCSNNLSEFGFAKRGYVNTALAAKYVGEQKNINYAALCTKIAADEYGLKILKNNFNDTPNNKTLFIAISRNINFFDHEKPKDKITSLLFSIRNIPAALYKSLGGFATNDVNVIKLESYIPGGKSKEAEFFISFEGSPENKNVKYAIEELSFFSSKVRILGTYNKASER